MQEVKQPQSEDEKDAQSDREILESIHPDYFQGDDFDPCLYELKVRQYLCYYQAFINSMGMTFM